MGLLRRGQGTGSQKKAGKGNENRQRYGRRGKTPGSFLIMEDRPQPLPQQLPAPAQRQGRDGTVQTIAQGGGSQKGIPIGPPLTGIQQPQNRFITGKLTQAAHLPVHPADQGIEPMETQHQLHQPAVRQVPPFVMGQLMEKRVQQVMIPLV